MVLYRYDAGAPYTRRRLPEVHGNRSARAGTRLAGRSLSAGASRSVFVEAHGWDIAVTKSEAGGARFEITGVEQP